eukprot:186550-Rhodomonas_salina.3
MVTVLLLMLETRPFTAMLLPFIVERLLFSEAVLRCTVEMPCGANAAVFVAQMLPFGVELLVPAPESHRDLE